MYSDYDCYDCDPIGNAYSKGREDAREEYERRQKQAQDREWNEKIERSRKRSKTECEFRPRWKPVEGLPYIASKALFKSVMFAIKLIQTNSDEMACEIASKYYSTDAEEVMKHLRQSNSWKEQAAVKYLKEKYATNDK